MNTSENPEKNTSHEYTSRFRCGEEVGYTTKKWFQEALNKACNCTSSERVDIMNFIPMYSYGTVISVKFHRPKGRWHTYVMYDIQDNYTNQIELDIPSSRVKQKPEKI